MLDEAAVGYYSLAVSISTMWTFVLSAIIDSMKPGIMKSHKEDNFLYIKGNRLLYAIVTYISLLAAVGITIVAPVFINILYGEQYLPAVEPLRIVVWYVAFSYLGVARDIWIVCEKKQKYLKYLYGSSAIMNVFLNILLIPSMGVNGAALATLITQMSTIFVYPLFIKEFRPNVKLILNAVGLKWLFRKE